MSKSATSRRSPWVIGIVAVLTLVVLWNVGFVYVAVTGADPVDPSYAAERR